MQQSQSLTLFYTKTLTRQCIQKSAQFLLCIFVNFGTGEINLEINIFFSFSQIFQLVWSLFFVTDIVASHSLAAATQPMRTENFCCNTQISFLFSPRTTYPEAEKIIKITRRAKRPYASIL